MKPVVGGIRTHWRLLKEDQPTNQRPPTGNVTNIKDKDHHQVFHQLHQDLLQYDEYVPLLCINLVFGKKRDVVSLPDGQLNDRIVGPVRINLSR